MLYGTHKLGTSESLSSADPKVSGDTPSVFVSPARIIEASFRLKPASRLGCHTSSGVSTMTGKGLR